MSNVQADWDNRHFIANIQYNIMKVVTFLNEFGTSQQETDMQQPSHAAFCLPAPLAPRISYSEAALTAPIAFNQPRTCLC